MGTHPFLATGAALFLVPALVLVVAIGSTTRIPSILPLRNTPPQLSDFTPPYECPATNAPRSCTTPIKVAVECIDLRTIDPRNLMRAPSATELSNAEKACELLPMWLDKDPRIEIVQSGKENLVLKYMISPFERKFEGIQIFIKKTNFF